VIAVLAHPADVAGRWLVERWSAHDARLLTSADLSRPGWRAGEGPRWHGTAVLDGEEILAGRVQGVLVRTPAIDPAELGAVVPEDRAYCAAEMTAFLTWWLSGLECPVINRPTATSLSGPGWRPPTWHLVARRLGLVPSPWRWNVGSQRPLYQDPPDAGAFPHDHADVVEVTVVGGHCLGDRADEVAGQATALARAAQAEALRVRFDCSGGRPRFRWAEPWVDVSDPLVADALLERLLDPPAPSRSAAR
jgi:hypothetical protein